MERLQDTVSSVTTRRRKMAGHVLRLQRERPAHTAMYWVPEDGRRNRGRPKKTWRSTFKEHQKRWVSAGMVPAGSPVTVRDGGFSSPDAPRGTGGPKSRTKEVPSNLRHSAVYTCPL